MLIEILRTNPLLIVIGVIILAMLGYFVLRFVLPSRQLGKDLARAIEVLNSLDKGSQQTDLDYIGREAMTSRKLAHLWKEFSDTLHAQTAPDASGQERVVRWRSTVPAEVFFNVESLIAVELRTEYFKHQPGIFTGIGIIGTFAGLLKGLADFSVSSDPEVVRKSLDVLIHGVFEAFIVSCFAIFFAMLTTWWEKTSVTRRVSQVEELCQLLDSLFESGAGEEYLARLVKAGESSATQTAQLKDALVSDLKQMLADLTHQQTEAIASSFRESSQAQIQTTEESSERIAKAIAESLNDPLQKIAAAVNTTTDTNGEVVTRALNEALVTFSQKMEDMFGSQMGHLNGLLQQTAVSMQATVARFDQLAGNLGDAGKNAADAMGQRLTDALEAMEARQHSLNATMADFVSQLRDMVLSSQSETHEQTQQAMQMISERIVQLTDQLERQSRITADSHQEQQSRLGENASKVANQLASQVQASQAAMQTQLSALLDVLKEQAVQTRTAAEDHQRAISQQTRDTIDGLSGKLSSSIDTMDGQVRASMEAIQQQLGTMTATLQQQSIQTAEASEAQQRRFVDDSQRVVSGMASSVSQSIGELEEKMAGLVGALSQQSAQSSQTHLENQNRLADQATRLIEALGQQVQLLTAQVNAAVGSMDASVRALREVSTESTRRLEGSAQTLGLAADNFAKAGNSVSGVIQQAGTVSDKMVSTTVSLNQASSAVEKALASYNEAGQAMITMVGELKTTVEVARRDATVSQGLVEQIREAADHLKTANTEVNGVFEKVCEELANAHEAFAKNVENSLRRGNTAYQKELKDAVDYLKSAIEELGEVAEKIPARK